MIKQQIFPTLFPVKGFFYVSLLLGILKEITGSSLMWKTDSEEEVAVVFDMVQKVFQQMLECMALELQEAARRGFAGVGSSLGRARTEGQHPAGGPGCGARPAGPGARWVLSALGGRCHAAGDGCPVSFHWCCPLSLGQHAPGGGREAGSPPSERCSGDCVGSSGQRAVGSKSASAQQDRSESPLQ